MIIYAEEVLTLLDLKLMFYYDLLSFLSGLASGKGSMVVCTEDAIDGGCQKEGKFISVKTNFNRIQVYATHTIYVCCLCLWHFWMRGFGSWKGFLQ